MFRKSLRFLFFCSWNAVSSLDCRFRRFVLLLSYSHTVNCCCCCCYFFFQCEMQTACLRSQYILAITDSLAHFSLCHTTFCTVVLSSFVPEYSSTSFSSKFMDIVLLTDLHAECRIFVVAVFSPVFLFRMISSLGLSFFFRLHLVNGSIVVINFGALSMILSMFSGTKTEHNNFNVGVNNGKHLYSKDVQIAYRTNERERERKTTRS